jgi:hypothetical protein
MLFLQIAGRMRPWFGLLVAVLALVLVAASTQADPIQLRLDNGIEATIYSPDDILARWVVRDGDRTWLFRDAALRYQLVTDVADPVITNKGDGSFHPMDVDAVIAALSAVRVAGTGLAVEIFVLPYPRRDILDSSARDGVILLSPGTRPVSQYAVHFTVTHEVGHVFQYRWMPDTDVDAWQRYSNLRGIQDTSIFSAAGAHKNRPHEIFAEDFRFLFGGDKANYSGSIENETLALPDEIAGLATFLHDLGAPRPAQPFASLATAPNPFNPSTEVRILFHDMAAPARAQVRIYDAEGRSVRQLYDATPATPSLRLPWDGRAEDGSPVASGVYFARLDYRGAALSTKLLLVK